MTDNCCGPGIGHSHGPMHGFNSMHGPNIFCGCEPNQGLGGLDLPFLLKSIGFDGNIFKMMPYDVQENENVYTVIMPLPGKDIDEIEISAKGNTLKIETDVKKGEESDAEPEKEEKEENEWSMKLLWERPINQELSFQNDIDIDTIKARLQKGILTLKIKKKDIPETKIEVEE